jgi:hypothetical protein
MESLAALVATILFGLIAIALLNLILALLVRRGKLKLWVGIVSNSITGIAAIIGMNGSWVIGAAPLISVLAGVVILALPKNS